MKLRSWKTGVAVLALGALVALGSSSTADAKGNLVVKRFLLGRLEPNTDRFIATGARGTTNAFRDNVVMFVFSAPVNFDTLDSRTVKIGIPAGGNLFIDADGAFYRYVLKRFNSVTGTYEAKKTYKNRVIFDPTKRQDPLLNRNPYGFEENSLYSVTVPGLDSGTTKVVRSTQGKLNQRTFTTTFRTSDQYLQDYEQPHIVEIVGSDAPTIALDGRSNVDSKADVVARFSEPMLPSTFDPKTTFRVFNFGQNQPTTGVIRPSPDGLTFTFRPAYGYGRGPFNVQATLTVDLTDRSGNPLDKGAVVNFVSELDLLAPSYNEIVESFDDNTYEDTDYQNTYDKAEWNGKKTPGILAGTFGSKSLDIRVSSGSGHGIPWWNSQAHVQILYSNSQVGTTARTVSALSWRYYTGGAPIITTYNSVTVQLGHNTSGTLNTNWTGSYSDTPVTVHPAANYTVPTGQTDWISFPAFSATWPYNGRDNMVLDINTPTGGTSINYWGYNSGGYQMVRAYSGGAATILSYSHDLRIYYLVDRSEAQSLWYDTDVSNPTFLDVIVTQTTPPGTVLTLIYQGAHEDPNAPNTPDLAAASQWTTDPLNDLPGFRFLRFHADATSNLGSSTRPTVEEIKLPFIYY